MSLKSILGDSILKNKSEKIRTRTILVGVFIMLIIILILGYTSVRVSTDVMGDQIYEASFKSLENIRDDFLEQTKQINNCFASVYDETEFIEALTVNTNSKNLQSDYSGIAKTMALNSFPTDRHVVAMYIYDINHNRISYYRHADSPKYHYPTDIYSASSEDDIYNATKVKEYVESSRNELMISSYYNTARDTDIVRFVYKIYVENRGRCVGYIVCDMDSSVFEKKINAYTYYDGQVVYIQPLGDRVAVSVGQPETAQSKILEDMSNEIARMPFSATKKVEVTSDNGNKIFLQSMPRYGLEFYSMLPESMILENQRSMIRNIAVISIIILILAALILYLFINRINNEYRDIQKNTEYKALQAQINPHFLYNTLDTISGMARAKQCIDISDMCMALSGMFRYSMGLKEEVVTLQKEMSHLRNYLYVMSTRKQNEIDINIDIAGEYMGLMMPKITLQPVVENAFKHGLNNVRGEKILKIYAETIEGKVHIIVEDNGPGFDPTEIKQRLREFTKNDVMASESIGLMNINSRIKYLYGNDYGIDIDSAVGEGCRVHIILPTAEIGE